MKYTTLDHNYYYFIIKTSSLPNHPKKKKSTNSHNVTNLPTLSWSKKSHAPVYYRNENRNPRVKHRIPKCPKARKNVEKGLLNEGKPGWR